MWKPLILVVAAAIVAPLADAGRAVAAPVPAPPATKTITVLTYNTHLFEDPDGKYNNVAVWGASTVAKKKVTYDDDNRARLIAEKVKSCGADIVGLQEVWAFKRQKWFATLLSKTYPYAYYPPKPKVVKKFALSEVVIGFSNGKLTGAGYISPQVTTSGLVLLSKYPLTNPGFSPFPARKAHKLDDFKDQDFWAGKGIITATVPLSPGGPTFRVGVSHAYVDAGGPSLQNPAQLAASTMAGWMPAIVMGDLNVSSSTGDYAKMQTIFRQFDATDAYVDAYKKMHPGSDPRSMKDSYTVNWQINLLSQVFSNRAGDGKCLDYVFVKNSGPFLTLQPEETRVIRDWNYPIQSFSFTDKKDIEGRIFALKTDKGLPVKMMVRVVDQNKTKWKRNAVLELRYVVYDKNNPKGRRSGIAKLGPRVDWKGKNEWIISGLDFDSDKVTTSGLLKKFPGPYPAPNDLTASAHRADFKLRFKGPYADTTGDDKKFDSLDEKGIAHLLTSPHVMDLSDHYPVWVKFKAIPKKDPVGQHSEIAKLGPRVDWKGKNEWIISGLDFDSGKVTTSGLLKKFPGPYPAPNDLTASAHRADFKLRFNGPYADTTGDVKRFDSLDEKAIAQLLAKPNKAAQPFSFAAKKDIEGRIFVLRTDKGLPVKMMFRVTSENKTKWKRNAVLELWYVVYRH